MLNNIQIYHIKAEDPMINNTSIGKQMHIAKEEKHGKCLVGLVIFHYRPDDSIFGFLTVKHDGCFNLTIC